MKYNSVIKSNSLLETKTVTLQESKLKIRYAELGYHGNPPILLLHGVPENLHGWYAVAPLLSESYHVFAIDWPGFGGSDSFQSSEDYTSRKFATVILDFLNTLNIPQVTLIATDIALLPAFLLGLEYPDRVSKIVVMDGIPFPRPQYSSWELKAFTRKGSIVANALVRWFPSVTALLSYSKGFYNGHSIPVEIQQEFLVDIRKKSTQDAFLSYFQNFHIGQKYFEQHGQHLSIPVLVVWGKYDRFINVRLAHEIIEKLPNAKLEVIDRSGHYVHMDKPHELVNHILKFFKEHSFFAVNSKKHKEFAL